MINPEELRNYCNSKKGVTESFPFGGDTLVFKVMSKLFLLTGIDTRPTQFNVKCKPEKAIELRETFSCVLPGYHMNKKHWNTVVCEGTASKKQLFEWINHSYELVAESLTKKEKEELSLFE